jgi:hypothetical protein
MENNMQDAQSSETLPLDKATSFVDSGEAVTIDEVIMQMEALIGECININDRLGYFAALYHKVTVRVKEGIQNNEFEDGPRMGKLDVIFANRFLSAARQWKKNEKPTGPWQITFQTAKKRSVLVLQHLLLGMNAHINLDLGIAAAQVTAGTDIKSIRNDFSTINAVLGSLTFELLKEINRVSPLLSLFGLHATNNSLLIQFSITNARDGSWAFAEELSMKNGADYETCIITRADTIQKLALALLKTRGLIKITIWIIHLFEWKRPRKIIKVLYESSKKFIHADG